MTMPTLVKVCRIAIMFSNEPDRMYVAYATDLFLDSIINTSIKRAQDILGHNSKKLYLLPKDKVENSKRRFDNVLQTMAERLRQHAAAWLSTRSAQKRRASGDTNPGRSVVMST